MTVQGRSKGGWDEPRRDFSVQEILVQALNSSGSDFVTVDSETT